MANCININSLEYQELLKKSGMKEQLLKAEISLWQQKTGNMDSFPTLNQLIENVEQSLSFTVKDSIDHYELSKDQVKTIYDNYVSLMDRKREGKAITFDTFLKTAAKLQVFNYKGTYIFGEWDKKNNVFKGRFISSPGIKELFTAVDIVKSNIDFVATVPEDMGKMLEKKNFFKVEVPKPYNFKGEQMIKYMYFSNKQIAEKMFNKPIESVTLDDIEQHDEYYNYWNILQKLGQSYENKDLDSIFTYLKELGIYDYNAYRLVKKVLRSEITKEDIENTVQEVKKNSASNKVNIDKKDLLNNPIIYTQLDNEVNALLASYLSNFGIKTEMLDTIQAKMGIDSLATVDILNKIIYTDLKDQSEYAEKAGMLIAYMMQHNPLVAEIVSSLKYLSEYKNLSSQEAFEQVGKMIANELYKKKKLNVPQSLVEKIKELISKFFNVIVNIRLDRINRNIGIIADNIMLQNQSMITASIYKPGAPFKNIERISLAEALKSDDFGASIIDKMANYFILTGSITLAEQGTVYRPNENQIHDLDWVSPYDKETTINIFNKLYPENSFIRTIKGEKNDTYTFLIAPEGYFIRDLKLEETKKRGETEKRVKIGGYNIVDAEGNVVSEYIPKSDSHTGPIAAKLIDFFVYDNEEYRKEDSGGKAYRLPSGKKLMLSNWQITFKAKLNYGRLKDIWDYNRFIPNDNVYTEENKPIKEGVAEVFEQTPELVLIGTAQEYSDYLDTTTDPSIEGFQEYMDFKNNVKDYFNLNEEDAKFVKDISNLKLNC